MLFDKLFNKLAAMQSLSSIHARLRDVEEVTRRTQGLIMFLGIRASVFPLLLDLEKKTRTVQEILSKGYLDLGYEKATAEVYELLDTLDQVRRDPRSNCNQVLSRADSLTLTWFGHSQKNVVEQAFISLSSECYDLAVLLKKVMDGSFDDYQAALLPLAKEGLSIAEGLEKLTGQKPHALAYIEQGVECIEKKGHYGTLFLGLHLLNKINQDLQKVLSHE